MENYIEKHKEKIQNTPGGTLCQVFGDKENASCSIALVKMDENSNGIKHYHTNITEIYLFSKGQGSIIINENENTINEGDIYIIPANNTHYIHANTKMEFACICTPPWTEEREIATNQENTGPNITKTNQTGIIQVLGPEPEHNVKMYKTNEIFNPNNDMKNYRRVYYFITGTGTITIDNINYNIEPNSCYEVLENKEEYITPTTPLNFVLVCDKLYQE